nr:hypothetical protein [uncultured Thiodictyon sp.]
MFATDGLSASVCDAGNGSERVLGLRGGAPEVIVNQLPDQRRRADPESLCLLS